MTTATSSPVSLQAHGCRQRIEPNPISTPPTDPLLSKCHHLCHTDRKVGDWCTDTRHACVPCVESDMSSDMSQVLTTMPITGMKAGVSVLANWAYYCTCSTPITGVPCEICRLFLMWFLDTAWARMTWGLFPSPQRVKVPKSRSSSNQFVMSVSILSLSTPFPPFLPFLFFFLTIVPPQRFSRREEWWGLRCVECLLDRKLFSVAWTSCRTSTPQFCTTTVAWLIHSSRWQLCL